MIKAILKHMAEFNEMRKLVQFTDSRYKNFFEDDIMVGFTEDDEDLMFSTEKELVDEYTKTSGKKYSEVVRLFKSAKEHNYLIASKTDDTKVMANPKEGYGLIQKRWRIPTGLNREALRENGTLLTITGGLIVGIATVINVIIAIVKP